jgi:hypothetical protein
VIKFKLPIQTTNETNGAHGHWAAKSRKRDKVRNAAALMTKAAFTPTPRIVVTLTRFSAGEMDDDGCRSALKSVRDGIASALRIDDGSKLIRFDYAQQKCERGNSWVEVTIE